MPVSFSFTFLPNWIVIILGLVLAFGITWFTIPSIVSVSMLKNLCATSNGRTSHNNPIATLGGIAVFAGFVTSTVIFAGTYFKFELLYIICGLIIILFIGIKDDILIINPWKKLAGQIIAAALIVVLADIRITSFYGLFGVNQIPYSVSILFTIFVFLIITNGFNLIDGIDGLASGVSILTSSIFGIWFWMIGNIDYTILSFSLAGSLLAFFYFNVFSKKNKLFLGDTGSLVTGFVMGVLACRFLQLDLIANGAIYIQSAPAIVFGILIVPLFDTLRVFILRFVQGKSPFTADRQHIHHRLLQLGITHLQATLILISVNLIFIVLCYLLQGIGIIWLTGLILGLTSLMSLILVIFAKKRTTNSIDSGYTVEGTWTRRIKKKRTGSTRHINNISLHYPEKVDAGLK
jgi:UDP-N-acetylmuramyl pentapeptide phosphotransferase/UDP-N-acetylglucosamine-1-phosphate transferase